MNSSANIWKAFVDNELDDEARRFWGKDDNRNELDKPYHSIVLYQGRGGKTLLTLEDIAIEVIGKLQSNMDRVVCCLGLPGISRDKFTSMAERFGFVVEKSNRKAVWFFSVATGEVFTVDRDHATEQFRQIMQLV